MIVPMKKICLITLGDKKTQTLSALRKLGLVHIEISEGSGEKLQNIKERISLLEGTLFRLGKTKDVVQKEASLADVLHMAQELAELSEEQKNLLDQKRNLRSKLSVLESWSNADPHTIAYLKDKGTDIALYEMPRSKYDNLGDDIKTLCLEKTRYAVKFLSLGKSEELSDYLVTLPDKSSEQINRELECITQREEEISAKISSCAAYSDSIKKSIKTLEKEKEFETYRSGMAGENISSGSNAEGSVAYFTGYIEEDKLPALKETAKENSWGLIAEDPTPEDNVPTKLKNNKFVSLIYPLTDFLGTVPGYFEHDISAWFLGFIDNEESPYAFVVICENSGSGSSVAGSIANTVLQALVNKPAVK